MKATRVVLVIGTVAVLAGFATTKALASASDEAEGRWRGFVLRSGLREPIAVDLEEVGTGWAGHLSAGDNTVALDNVIVEGSTVHFDAPGEGGFDGTVAGGSMAGSLSGPTAGSFSLSRDRTNSNWGMPDLFLGP